MNLTIAKEVDTKGMACPLPILKAKRALAQVSSRELIRVEATDTATVRDFQAFAKQTGNELVEQTNTASEYIHILRRR